MVHLYLAGSMGRCKPGYRLVRQPELLPSLMTKRHANTVVGLRFFWRLFDAYFGAFQIQVQLIAGTVILIIDFFHFNLFFVLRQDLNIHT
jgi:hypothetical protein